MDEAAILAWVDSHPETREVDLVAQERAQVRQTAVINALARLYRTGVLKREKSVVNGERVTLVSRVSGGGS